MIISWSWNIHIHSSKHNEIKLFHLCLLVTTIWLHILTQLILGDYFCLIKCPLWYEYSFFNSEYTLFLPSQVYSMHFKDVSPLYWLIPVWLTQARSYLKSSRFGTLGPFFIIIAFPLLISQWEYSLVGALFLLLGLSSFPHEFAHFHSFSNHL